MASAPPLDKRTISAHTAQKISKVSKTLSEYLHYLANEPSIGLYQVQEHIRRTIPRNSELKSELKKRYQAVDAVTYDVNFSLQIVKGLHDLTTFVDIKHKLDHCIEIANQLSRVQPSPVRNAQPRYNDVNFSPAFEPLPSPKNELFLFNEGANADASVPTEPATQPNAATPQLNTPDVLNQETTPDGLQQEHNSEPQLIANDTAEPEESSLTIGTPPAAVAVAAYTPSPNKKKGTKKSARKVLDDSDLQPKQF